MLLPDYFLSCPKFLLAFLKEVYYTIGASCRCDGMVDVADAKPPLRTRAPPVAEEARVQQVQRSVRDDGVHAEDIHRAPQTLATSAAAGGHLKNGRQRSMEQNV